MNDQAKSRMTPAEEARQAEVMSVALDNPDRRGDPHPRAADPLWKFVRRESLRPELLEAGDLYEEVSRKGKRALDIGTPGASVLTGGAADNPARDARTQLDAMRYKAAIFILKGVDGQCFSAVERVCYDGRDPWPGDERSLVKGLYALAVHFGVLKLGINRPTGVDVRGRPW